MITMKTYSVEDLSIYFGVSQNTMLGWLNAGRFVPVNNLAFKKDIRLQENALWIARTGKCYSIAQIVSDWHEENKHTFE